MKTEFYINCENPEYRGGGMIKIIGKKPENKPYLSLKIGQIDPYGTLEGKELEQLAVNILKALNSKHLEQSK